MYSTTRMGGKREKERETGETDNENVRKTERTKVTGRKKALKETHIAIMLTAQYIYTYSFMNVDKQGGKLKRYEGCPVSTRPGSKNRWLGRGGEGGS